MSSKFSAGHYREVEKKSRSSRLQELAWPHLLEGRSAIIVDPSDNLADLMYLPVICTNIEVILMATLDLLHSF